MVTITYRQTVSQMQVLKDIDRELLCLLLDNIQGHKGNLTYKEVANALSERLGRTINPHFGLAEHLGAVSTLCCELGLPLISATVIYSGANVNRIGEGFYPLACELKPEYKVMEPIAVWKKELQLIRSCKDWTPLEKYLGASSYQASTDLLAKRVKKQTASNPFSDCLRQHTSLSDASISKYVGAVGTISREMYNEGVIFKPIINMTAFELDVAIPLILDNPSFIQKNKRGNHMYSNAIKQYRYYLNLVSDRSEDASYEKEIEADTTISVTERRAIVQSRIGQGIFRKSLFEKYDGKCLITGIDHPTLLVASHIKPWAVSSNTERLSVENGLLLSATYDKLFDSGLITFSKDGTLYCSSFIGSDNLKRLHLEKGMHFNLRPSQEMSEYLEFHSDKLFVR